MAAPFTIRRREHNSKAAILLDHQTAGIPLVRVGGIRNGFDANVREDFTTAVLAAGARTGARPSLDCCLLGGEPYARWI